MKVIPISLLLAFICFSCQSNPGQPVTSDCSFLNDVKDSTRLICGQLTVPENHAKPNGRTIEISYVVLKSENPESKEYPMIHFTGGPGGQALRNIERYLSNPILKTRDIIRFDQRGIGYSTPLPDFTARIYDLISQDLTSEEEYLKMKDEVVKLRDECDERGIEIEAYNTFENARDVGLLMEHLGYDKYNLRGGSYGTRIARVVADMFPEKINTAIYDSPAPHKGDYLQTRIDDYSSALKKVIHYCQDDPGCQANYPQLESDYYTALDEIAADPVKATYKSKPYILNPQDAIFMLRYELYRNDSRDRVPRYIKALKERDIEWINRVLAFRGLSTSNFAMFLACENFEEYDHKVTEEVINAKYAESEMMPYELALFTSMYKASSKFLKRYAPREDLNYMVSEIPSLIFINQFDPVTPPENAAIFQAKLPKSQAFIIDAGGHGGGDMKCKRSIMDAFMSDPGQELQSSCLRLWVD